MPQAAFFVGMPRGIISAEKGTENVPSSLFKPGSFLEMSDLWSALNESFRTLNPT
jgi:hypothetical protein